MVCDGNIEVGWIAAISKRLVTVGILVGSDVKWVSSGESNVLIFWSVVNAVFTHEFKRFIRIISFENSNSTLGKRDAKTIGFSVAEFNSVSCFKVWLRVAACTDANKIVFTDGNIVDFRDELHLFLRVVIERNRLAQGVHMIIWKRFFRKWRRRTVHSSWRSCLFHHRWLNLVLSCIHITSDKLKLGIKVSLSWTVVDSDPSTDVSFSFSVIECDWIIWFPRKASCSVSYFTISRDSSFTENFPIQSGNCEKSLWKWSKPNTFDVVENLYPGFSLKNVSGVMAKKNSIDFEAIFS